jgi:hypothetical protein
MTGERDPLAAAWEAMKRELPSNWQLGGENMTDIVDRHRRRIEAAIRDTSPTTKRGIFGPSDDDIVAAWREAQVWISPLAETPRQNDLESARQFLRAIRDTSPTAPQPDNPRMHNHANDDHYWQDCPGCDDLNAALDRSAE